MTLYNLKSDGDQYRITKFTNDLEVQSSYLVTADECDCPAGHHFSCRHREMLPHLLPHVDTERFWDYEHKEPCDKYGLLWITPALSDLPDGITCVTFDDPAKVHNAIAEAVGEPTLPPASWRRI